MEREEITYQGFCQLIISYIDIYKPSVRDTLGFVGGLYRSIIEKIDMTEEEKEIYIDLYTKLIIKKIKSKEKKEASLV